MNPNVKVTPMSAEMAIREWPTLEGIITKVLDHACGRFSMDDVKERVASGHIMPLMIWDPEEKHIYAVICAEAQVFPLKKVFQLSICAGEDISEWGHVYPAIRSIAKEMGFDQIDVVGRPGWKKFVTGAHDIASVLTEDL